MSQTTCIIVAITKYTTPRTAIGIARFIPNTAITVGTITPHKKTALQISPMKKLCYKGRYNEDAIKACKTKDIAKSHKPAETQGNYGFAVV